MERLMEHLAGLAGGALVSGVWQGLVLAAVVWMCLRLAPRASAALRFGVWAVVFGVIALLPFAESVGGGRLDSGAAAVPVLAVDLRWSLGIAAIWLACSVYRAGTLGVQALRLGRLARRAVPMSVSVECAALLAGSKRSRKVQLCSSAEIDRPSVIGFMRPRILIPEWLAAELTGRELEQIVLHEMEHLRRGDDWVNLLQKISLVLVPLNPILLWVERRLCLERELACDDGVLRRTKAPRAYATCLTNLAERGLDRRVLALALGALERRSQLAERVHRILRREKVLTAGQSRGLTGAVAVVLIGCATGLARCPQLISFGVKPAEVAGLPVSVLPAADSGVAGRFGAVRAEKVRYAEAGAEAPRAMMLQVAAVAGPAARVVPHTVARNNRRSFGCAGNGKAVPCFAQDDRFAQDDSVVAGHAFLKTALRSKADAVARAVQTRRVVRPSRPASNGRALLTSWAGEDSPAMILPAAVELPAAMDFNLFHPYAAVRVDGGWLIVQL